MRKGFGRKGKGGVVFLVLLNASAPMRFRLAG